MKYIKYFEKKIEWDDFDFEEEIQEEDDWDIFEISTRREKYFDKFIEFLDEKNASTKFLTNLENSKNARNFAKSWDDINYYFEYFQPEEWILQSFSWVDSPEGYEFWKYICNEWQKLEF
jgi:hypothetical protein